MTDLVEFLEARLAEDERLATRAASLCGCCPPSPNWQLNDDEAGGRITLDNPHNLKLKLTRRWNGSYGDLFIGEHIAAHDPARVLREVQAKRRILDEVVAQIDGMEAQINSEWGSHSDPPEPREHLPLLRLLAAPYADHPDYRAEWGPS